MKSIATAILMVLLLTACFNFNGPSMDFRIMNHTSYSIDTLRIGSHDHATVNTHSMIAVNDTLLSTLDMSVLTADGAYALYIRFDNDSVFQKSFGYYTNGYPLEERIDIRILPDTLIISAQF
jgi:hypothetical protein